MTAAAANDVSVLLVANRGEIALRIMRTARAMGLKTVAVYSDADSASPHVRAADIAVRIGPGPASESYLSIDAILAAAKTSNATAIHPGYGFLSENAAFAQAVIDAGLVFVGPPPSAIAAMGDKARAKRRMIKAGIPCVPGYEGEDQSDSTFLKAAAETGYPVMIKASGGGGGRGMRLVHNAADLPGALQLARSEAQNAFGNGELILEKAILRPRHVEIQVFADTHGAAIHLGERDCSVQRRHQKVIEESPCPVMTTALRDEMGAAAVNAAKAVGYVGAGTVEFLLDEAGRFYFLEMNTRLQVEHPVTEMVTGLDLVALQLRVAQGDPLGLAQNEVRLAGSAIEVRLYAEEPEAGFLPSAGPLHLFRMAAGEGVRIDAGVESGGEVSAFYDPLLAKVIAHGRTREEARRRLVSALGAAAVFGPRTNRDFLIDALQRPDFAAGKATTAFIEETYGERFTSPSISSPTLAAAAVLQHVCTMRRASASALVMSCELLDWSSANALQTIVAYQDGEIRQTLSVRPGNGAYAVALGEKQHSVTVVAMDDEAARFLIDGRTLSVAYWEDGRNIYLATPERTVELANLVSFIRPQGSGAGQGILVAPMHGKLIEVCVAEGAVVTRGDRLAVLEAMKMQHELLAEIDGRIARVAATEGSQIAANSLILEIRAEPPADQDI